jgi:hypothetical protein
VRQDDVRHLVEAEQMRGEHPAVAGDNAVFFERGPGQHPATATNPEMPLNVLLADHPDAASLVDIGALGGNAPDDRQIPEERNCWC